MRSGVVGALPSENPPRSSLSTTSLKVPPVSTAILYLMSYLAFGRGTGSIPGRAGASRRHGRRGADRRLAGHRSLHELDAAADVVLAIDLEHLGGGRAGAVDDLRVPVARVLRRGDVADKLEQAQALPRRAGLRAAEELLDVLRQLLRAQVLDERRRHDGAARDLQQQARGQVVALHARELAGVGLHGVRHLVAVD